jgi:hypothetical protein
VISKNYLKEIFLKIFLRQMDREGAMVNGEW